MDYFFIFVSSFIEHDSLVQLLLMSPNSLEQTRVQSSTSPTTFELEKLSAVDEIIIRDLGNLPKTAQW